MIRLANRLVAATIAAVVLAAPLAAHAEEYATPFAPQAGRQTYVATRGFVPAFVAYTEYRDGDPIPAGYHKETRMNGGLVAGGLGLFLGAWGMSAIVGSLGAPALAVPLVGPIFAAAQPGSGALVVAGAVDAVAQVAGLSMFLGGLASPRTILVPDVGFALRVTPIVGPSNGAMVTGTF